MAESPSHPSARGPLADLDEWETVFDAPRDADGSSSTSGDKKAFRD